MTETTKHLHKMVQDFIDGREVLLARIDEFPKPLEDIVEAVYEIQRARGDRENADRAFDLAEDINLPRLEPNLALYFLSNWALLCIIMERHEQALCLEKYGDVLADGNNINPEILSLFKFCKANIAASIHSDSHAEEEVLRSIIELLPPDSSRYVDHVRRYASFLAKTGRFAEIEREVTAIENTLDEESRHFLFDPIKAVSFLQRGYGDECAEVIDRMLGNAAIMNIHGATIRHLAINAATLRDKPLPLDKDAQPHNISQVFALTSYWLRLKNSKKALYFARHSFKLAPKFNLRHDIDCFCLLRAELASGNTKATLRLLEQRKNNRAANYIDHFFWTRLELLRGNIEEAAAHYSTLIKLVERYGATPRLDFELSLSMELQPAKLSKIALIIGKATSMQNKATIRLKDRITQEKNSDFFSGSSQSTVTVRNLIKQFSNHEVPIYISGKPGSGKRTIARALHKAGSSHKNPFIKFDCRSMPPALLELELFGCTDNYIQGLEQQKESAFSRASKGTLFLNNIESLTPELQESLLETLANKSYIPLGSEEHSNLNCHIIVASTLSSSALDLTGDFHRDLIETLSKMEINVPSLRERPEDIIPLAEEFLNSAQPDDMRAVMSEPLKEAFENYEWPGNITELKHTINCMILENSDKILYTIEDMNEEYQNLFTEKMSDNILVFSDSEPLHKKGSTSTATNGKKSIADDGRSSWQMEEKARQLFLTHKKLGRKEIARLLAVSSNTVTHYLRILTEEGFIKKVMPNTSPCTHYFILAKQD